MKQRRTHNGAQGADIHSSPVDSGEFAHLLVQAVDNNFDLIGMTDCEGRFTFANRAMLRTLGCSRGELVGKHFKVLLTKHNSEALFQEIAEHLFTEGGWQGECMLSRQDGTGFPIFLNAGPIRDRSGSLVGTFGIGRDITERQRAEEALRQSEEQFRQLAENIREVFFVTTPAPAKVLYVSPAYDEIWGRVREEIYERPTAWIDSIHPEDRVRASESFAQCQQGVPTNVEYRVIRPDGGMRWISNRAFPVRDSKGTFCRVVGIAEDITKRKEEERELREAHEKLNHALQESERLARDAVRLTELVDILQSCRTAEEAYKVIADVLPTIIPSRGGALCMTSPSRNIVEATTTWGGTLATDKTFPPDSCWGLRRGKIHLVTDSTSPLRCVHVRDSVAGGHLCVPLAAQGETLGVLYLEGVGEGLDGGPEPLDSRQNAVCEQARAVGERISLALANLRLREVLRNQSIRDPLTGLFNRRYMEESLERELSRANRHQQPLALVMFDIDLFKQFNDIFGHQAGDSLLRELGDFLLQRTRGQDVACRYGGEEFALILSGASAEGACKRVELLREELKSLTVEHAGQVLGRITFSIGIAAYPAHGTTSEELLRAADRALYLSKTEGRDRITVA